MDLDGPELTMLVGINALPYLGISRLWIVEFAMGWSLSSLLGLAHREESPV